MPVSCEFPEASGRTPGDPGSQTRRSVVRIHQRLFFCDASKDTRSATDGTWDLLHWRNWAAEEGQ